MLPNAFLALLFVTNLCKWTKLAIYSRVTAGSNIVHIIKKKDITRWKKHN